MPGRQGSGAGQGRGGGAPVVAQAVVREAVVAAWMAIAREPVPPEAVSAPIAGRRPLTRGGFPVTRSSALDAARRWCGSRLS